MPLSAPFDRKKEEQEIISILKNNSKTSFVISLIALLIAITSLLLTYNNGKSDTQWKKTQLDNYELQIKELQKANSLLESLKTKTIYVK